MAQQTTISQQDQHTYFTSNAISKKQVNYISRDFQTIRNDLVNYLRAFYPDQWQDFNTASIGSALLDLSAYVGDLLSYSIDKKFNELFLDGVSERRSVYRIAKTMGYSVCGTRPAVCIADIIIEIPPTSEGPDQNYMPIYRAGIQVQGGGQTFETVSDIDFSSDYSELGTANRVIEPILNASQDLVKYRILKREIVKAGITKQFKVEVTAANVKQFFSITLPETNVLEITSVIVESGVALNYTPTYEDYNNFDKKYWEVDALPTNKIFTEDDTQSSVNGIKIGKYVTVNKRFVKEFMSNGTCKLTFGGGDPNYDSYTDYLTQLTNTSEYCYDFSNINTSALLQNLSLGEAVQENTTLYIKYRVGGGPLSNVGSNVLQGVSSIKAVIFGADATLNQSVISSTQANNPIPALGGAGLPSVDEIRHFISGNFAAQSRCINLEDYVSRAYQMPGKFGGPFRIFGVVEDNKVKLYILSKGADGKLVATSTSTIKNNIVEYITPYRSINDFVEINDGKFVNLEIEVDLFTDKVFNGSEVKLNVIKTITDFFNIDNWQMNQHIYVSQITDSIRETPGVINVVDIRFYNLDGGIYSTTMCAQASGNRIYMSDTNAYRTQIEYVNNAIYSTPISMFELRYPEKNVKVRVS